MSSADIVEIVVILAVEERVIGLGYPFVHEAGLTDSWRNIARSPYNPVGAGRALQTFRGLNLSPMPTCLKLDKSRSWHVEGPSCPRPYCVCQTHRPISVSSIRKKSKKRRASSPNYAQRPVLSVIALFLPIVESLSHSDFTPLRSGDNLPHCYLSVYVGFVLHKF